MTDGVDYVPRGNVCEELGDYGRTSTIIQGGIMHGCAHPQYNNVAHLASTVPHPTHTPQYTG